MLKKSLHVPSQKARVAYDVENNEYIGFKPNGVGGWRGYSTGHPGKGRLID